jgi:hypothetical protein
MLAACRHGSTRSLFSRASRSWDLDRCERDHRQNQSVGGWRRRGPDDPVVGLENPVEGRRLFRYAGGIPGRVPSSVGSSVLLAGAAELPIWRAPRMVRSRGVLVRIVFRTGARSPCSVTEAAEFGLSRGRLRTVRVCVRRSATQDRSRRSPILSTWPAPTSTTRPGRAFELVPVAWRGAGYRHWFAPELDSTAETG